MYVISRVWSGERYTACTLYYEYGKGRVKEVVKGARYNSSLYSLPAAAAPVAALVEAAHSRET